MGRYYIAPKALHCPSASVHLLMDKDFLEGVTANLGIQYHSISSGMDSPTQLVPLGLGQVDRAFHIEATGNK